MWHDSRRNFLKLSASGLIATGGLRQTSLAQQAGDRPAPLAGVTVENPRLRVPLSFIIDDSTCLVNLNKFSIPQFAEAWGKEGNFQQDWRSWPAEIPDSFVRKFGEWSAENGVKGKYSIVPYPACVGRMDRLLPGWTRRELDDSLKLVRELMLPNWDIHPEMVTHTWVIDTKTGQPAPERTLDYQENWNWTNGRSVDELADYMSYALQILKNAGLPCEGVTTPGGFAVRVLPELSQATLQACRDVFQAEIPHYFRHLYDSGEQSVAPRVENAAGLDTDDPRCVVSIVGCTGDWTGGWDCTTRGDVDRFITADLQQGRMVDVIERGEPACMVCHWTGIYYNGEEEGFRTFQEVVGRLHSRYDHLSWMKLSEIARYWAAKELTQFRAPNSEQSNQLSGGHVEIDAPFATPLFTVRIATLATRFKLTSSDGKQMEFRRVGNSNALESGCWLGDAESAVVCFDLPRGKSTIQLL
ncbi:MAG: hypothetical protein IT422_21045 [Pirellulaceae bacterium]|nr:hypothetical protein [Pirellulaceae bacterium]